MKLDRILQLVESQKINSNTTKVTVTGKYKGLPVTLNVKLTGQNFDKGDEGSWDGEVTAVLGDQLEEIKHGDKVEVTIDRRTNKITVHGKDWTVVSGADKPKEKSPRKGSDKDKQQKLDI